MKRKWMKSWLSSGAESGCTIGLDIAIRVFSNILNFHKRNKSSRLRIQVYNTQIV